jgi:hypothetical protein
MLTLTFLTQRLALSEIAWNIARSKIFWSASIDPHTESCTVTVQQYLKYSFEAVDGTMAYDELLELLDVSSVSLLA